MYLKLAPAPCTKQHATETKTKEQHVNGERSESVIMKNVSQIHLEADTPRVELFKPKTKIRVGSWNMRTLYQTGKLQEVVLREMENYKIELLCVSEARWIDSGERTLSSHALDTWWQENGEETKGDMGKISRERNENTWMELGSSHEVDGR